MQAVILAGGLGTRLRPLTQSIPKSLLPIGEKSLLEIQISRLKAYGFDEIFLATNYKAQYITDFFGDGSRYGVKLEISTETEPLGTAGPLSLLREKLSEPFVLMNGDILSTIDFRDLYSFSMSVDAELCVAIKEIVTPFAFGRIESEGSLVTGIQEKPDLRTNVLAGIYVLRPDTLRLIPDGEYFGMDTLIKTMLAREIAVAKYDLREIWLDVGQLKDYERAQEVYETHFASEDETDDSLARSGGGKVET